MAQKPKSLKDLKQASQKANATEGAPKKIHAAIDAAKGNQFKGLALSICSIVMLLLAVTIFYVYSKAMTVKIGPDVAAPSGYVSLESGLGWISDDGKVYVLGSAYTISVHADGFHSEVIDITSETAKSFLEVTLSPKPASITLTTDPRQEGTQWTIDSKTVATGATYQTELEPGQHNIAVNHPYFEPAEQTLTLERASTVNYTFPLSRIQGQVNIQSIPTGASITIDGDSPIVLPHSGSLAGGKHVIQVEAPGYITVSDQIEVTNSKRLIQRNYRLRAKQSGIIVTVEPATARITIDGRSTNNEALNTVNANQSYSIEVSQEGYNTEQRTIRVLPAQTEEVSFVLEKAIGLIRFRAQPSGAEIYINGQNRGQAPIDLSLQAVPTKITFQKAGYRSESIITTPLANQSTTVSIQLLTELAARLKEHPPTMTDSSGIELIRFKPDQKAFYIGAERGEIGQRANEILRQVQLTKHFYAGKYEITVGQFRKFQPGFASGQANTMPVTGITWEQAAEFCNWLSGQQSLRPFYRISSSQVVGYDPYADGYRLPSEAEWEWLARKARRLELTTYTWGNKTVVTSASGNLADESAKGSLPTYIPKYDDKYAAVAPVGSFPAEVSGLHDMSGNVREWVNDRYDLTVPAKGDIAVNSFGATYGEGNVVKGSSFKSASLTHIRAASRHQEYSAADDIGFRVVRYVYGAEDK